MLRALATIQFSAAQIMRNYLKTPCARMMSILVLAVTMR